MLSIGAMKAGDGRYYTDLAREDYYLQGGEPPGHWWGRGARELGLRGRVKRKELGHLLNGFSPDRKALTQNAGREDRRPGWDLTFSAPKSVSVFWSQTDVETRRQIQQAHDAGVQAALEYLEAEASFSRRGQGGYDRDTAGLVVATFEHGTSRAGDPQLHSHCLFMNVAVRPDATSGSLFSTPLYHHKMAAGAVYRAQFAFELEKRLGLECERKRTWFELKGVPTELCNHFSQRRKAIVKRLSELGLETASAAAFAALDTRDPKLLVPARRLLIRAWQKTGAAFGFSTTQTLALLKRTPQRDVTRAYHQALTEAVKTITEQESHFSQKDLVRRTLEASQGRGLDAHFVRGWVKYDLQRSNRFVALAERHGERRYTTQDVLLAERRLYEIADRSRNRFTHFVSPDSLRLDTLNREQRDAVRHLTTTSGSIKLLSGLAGTGKTFALRACRQAWESAGYRVIGAALAGRAAKELQMGSGIESDTLRMLEIRMKPTLSHQLRHHGKQILRAATKKKTFRFNPLKIDAKTVLVIDEAGMVGTKQMARLLQAVEKHGGKVVLVGDASQLQPIEAGSPFLTLRKHLGAAELVQIARQHDEADRQVVRDLVAGRAQAALSSLAARGRVALEKTPEQAIEKLISDWTNESAAHPENSLILCGTNRDADVINLRCQRQQSLAGKLDTSQGVKLKDGYLFRGDRVLFTKRARRLHVENGDTGTVVGVHPVLNTVEVKLDSGEIVRIPLRTYQRKNGRHDGHPALKLGYALTTHKAQGSTFDNVFVLAGGPMQRRELTYVQLSRARCLGKLYTDELQAGEDLSRLVRQMEQSRAKDMAHDVIHEQQRGLGLRLTG